MSQEKSLPTPDSQLPASLFYLPFPPVPPFDGHTGPESQQSRFSGDPPKDRQRFLWSIAQGIDGSHTGHGRLLAGEENEQSCPAGNTVRNNAGKEAADKEGLPVGPCFVHRFQGCVVTFRGTGKAENESFQGLVGHNNP